MKSITVLVPVLIALTSCVVRPADMAMKALQRGDQASFCKISIKHANRDPFSANNLGVCHENGWNNYEQNTGEAIKWYKHAASYDVPKAKENLIRLGQPVPAAINGAVVSKSTLSNSFGNALTNAAKQFQTQSENLRQQNLMRQLIRNQEDIQRKLDHQQHIQRQQMLNRQFYQYDYNRFTPPSTVPSY